MIIEPPAESPEDIREMCISRVKQVLEYTDECLAGFQFNNAIPKDLVNDADDTLVFVFGIASNEVERYRAYRDQYNSFEEEKRREWLTNLRYDLKSGMRRLESTPARRYPILGLGAVENEGGLRGSVSNRIGLENPTTWFQRRIVEICKRIQVNLQFKCHDATAFLLRKILEGAVVERFKRDGRYADIILDGQVLGLEKLLNKASLSSGGWVNHRVVKELSEEKLLMDLSVHSLDYDPSPGDIDRWIALMKAVLQDLRVREL